MFLLLASVLFVTVVVYLINGITDVERVATLGRRLLFCILLLTLAVGMTWLRTIDSASRLALAVITFVAIGGSAVYISRRTRVQTP